MENILDLLTYVYSTTLLIYYTLQSSVLLFFSVLESHVYTADTFLMTSGVA